MSLLSGTQLGPYEILGAIGAGGMGEVYRARDRKLNRDVAIKVLPELFAADPERSLRLEREAQTLAALNHPNIAQIYGMEELPPEDGGHGSSPRALVIELVTGVDLSERIASGPLPVEEATAIAKQIADALEAAHELGIVHRDLKPANIKVRADGTVKILDFGLAKLAGPERPDDRRPAAAASFNTFTSPAVFPPAAGATAVGVILGTATYMAPEQAKGKPVDKRADIWAFGCVLFEMVTGRRAFVGGDVTEVIAAIVKDEPPWDAIPAHVPPSVITLIRRCLVKDPVRRLRDIGEARIVLVDDVGTGHAGAVTAHDSRLSTGRRLFVACLVAIAVGLAAVAGYLSRPLPGPRILKSRVALLQDGSAIRSPAISPDGRNAVFVSRSRLWVQSLETWEPRELAGTEGGTRPFWSPHGDWIAYFRSEQLLKVPASGGPVVHVATLPAVQAPLNAGSGIWREDGTLIISMAAGQAVYTVPSGGGELREFFKVPDAIGVDLHDLASLPGSEFVATVHRGSGIDAIGLLAGGTLKIVLEASNVAAPRYSASGHLVFARESSTAGLWAVPFSTTRREVTGEPFPIGSGSEPSIARDGTLLYRGEAENLARQLAWFTMDGQVGDTVAPAQNWIEGVALSPDGRRLLASASDGIWAYDVGSGARSRVTASRSDITPQWVSSSGDMVFVRTNGNWPDVMIKRADAGGDARVLAKNARFPSVTKDGRRIVFNRRQSGQTPWQVAWLDLDKPGDIHVLGDPHTGARFPVVSPDGELVAYVSGETGRDEIFLTRLAGGVGKWQLSTEGGGWCRFTAHGDAVVYREPGGDFMSVEVRKGSDLSIGRSQRLFEWGPAWLPFYELASDGKRGIAAVPVARSAGVSSLSLVQNWHLEFAGGR